MISNWVVFLIGTLVLKRQTETDLNNTFNIISATARAAPAPASIVAAILDETLLPEVTLFELAAGTPLMWEEQWGRVGGDRLKT
jgi:hypothetical protein